MSVTNLSERYPTPHSAREKGHLSADWNSKQHAEALFRHMADSESSSASSVEVPNPVGSRV
jgi:hypothetical protein